MSRRDCKRKILLCVADRWQSAEELPARSREMDQRPFQTG
jgi:hypothetical protein